MRVFPVTCSGGVSRNELLLKSRKAMIAAVHTFNSAGLTFRVEIFITTAVISWTYLLHARFVRAERRLPPALRFAPFDAGQRDALKAGRALPPDVETMMDAFHAGLTDDQQADPAFAYRVAFVPEVGVKASRSDAATEFVRPGTDEASSPEQTCNISAV